MGAGKILVFGAVAAGMAALVLGSKPANASALPAGWSPPAGAVVALSPANTLPGVGALKRITWRDSGNLGNTVLLFLVDDPHTFVAAFDPDNTAQQTGILQIGSTPLSATLAQALAAGII